MHHPSDHLSPVSEHLARIDQTGCMLEHTIRRTIVSIDVKMLDLPIGLIPGSPVPLPVAEH